MARTTFDEALLAPGPRAELAERLDLFGRFIGAWDLEWHGIGRGGDQVVVQGELHFAWILGGRAVQDVWCVPLEDDQAGQMRAFHGTTIRFYDPAISAWRSTWLNPVSGRVRRFVGHATDDGIVLDGVDVDPHARWRFMAITDNSFTWTSEESPDGVTWSHSELMYARRRDASPPL
jgi:hypothetical protein